MHCGRSWGCSHFQNSTLFFSQITHMISRDWFDWSNAAVGVTGLVLSGLAIVQATGAKQAAKQAVEAVHRKNTASSIEEVLRLTGEFSNWIECERRAEAMMVMREIVLRLGRIRGEFGTFLAADLDNLLGIELKFKRLADLLARKPLPFTSAAKRELFSEILEIVHESSAILGHVLIRAEQEGL